MGKYYYIDGIAFKHWRSKNKNNNNNNNNNNNDNDDGVDHDAYYDINLQQLDMIDTQIFSQRNGGLQIDVCYDYAYNGSACLSITGIILAKRSQVRICMKSFGFEADTRRKVAQLDRSIGSPTMWLDVLKDCDTHNNPNSNSSTVTNTDTNMAFQFDCLKESIETEEQGNKNKMFNLSRQKEANLIRMQQYGEMLHVQMTVAVPKSNGCDVGLVLNFSDDNDFEAKRRKAWTQHRHTADKNVRWKYERWQSDKPHSIILYGPHGAANDDTNENNTSNKDSKKCIFYPSAIEYQYGCEPGVY